MLELGRLYRGVFHDYVQAHKWLNLAASRGEVAAVEERDALVVKMAPGQISAAQQRAAAWQPSGRASAKASSPAKMRQLGISIEMLSIPAGMFRMGDLSGVGNRNERPVRSVTVPAFRLGKHEVTFTQWDACVADRGCNGYTPDDEGRGRDSRPVMNVSWNDIQSFIVWLNGKTGGNYRLPTEAEWEYAARAGTTTEYSWGDDIGSNRANCFENDCGDRYKPTAPVDSFPANRWGLHDMHGNVSEWVQDCWNDNYEGAPTDGSAWTSGDCAWSAVRGGSWVGYVLDLPSAVRSKDVRAFRSNWSGFRLAHDE